MRIAHLLRYERLNFLLTNRIPRRWATLLMGRLSRVENRAFTYGAFMLWRLFGGDFALHEAKHTQFKTLHALFTRELKEGARPLDTAPNAVLSPCDGVVGACGRIRDTELIQAKGFPYTLPELLGDERLVDKYRDGLYVTLRLRSAMYHRFHAPVDGRVGKIIYISGDTWNVNPIALRRIERLYCKNERAVLDIELDDPRRSLALVPVAAILVASIRFNFLDTPLNLRHRGANTLACNHAFAKGQELGMFEHGSTIIAFASGNHSLPAHIATGHTIRMGQTLFTYP